MSFSSHQALSSASSEAIVSSARSVAQALGSQQTYAIVGGAACVLLGSTRVTNDVDFVVPRGKTKAARALLKAHPEKFDIDKRTLHTFHRGNPPVEIEILAPPALFREEFSSSTSVVTVQGGVRVLDPVLLLNAKCGSILGRANTLKKDTDAEDIMFLLEWCEANSARPKAAQVPNASQSFVQWFTAQYARGGLWSAVGFNTTTGKLKSTLLDRRLV